MIEILRLGCGLTMLIVANVALGSIRAVIAREWNTKVFLDGLIKGGIVTLSFAAVWFAGWLNPDLVIVETDGQTVNLAAAVYLVLLTGFVYYAAAVLKKLKSIVTIKSSAVNFTTAAASQGAHEKIEAPDLEKASE